MMNICDKETMEALMNRLPATEDAIKARITVKPMEGEEGVFVATADFSDLFDGDATKVLKIGESGSNRGEGMIAERLAFEISLMIMGIEDCPPEAAWVLELPDRVDAAASAVT